MSRATCPACAEMKTNAHRKHTTAELEAYHPLRAEFEQATRGMMFTKVFNPSLDADMQDRLATHGQRVWAWILRQSWGNYSLYCVTEPDGNPLYQVDCAAALGIDKKRVSAAIAYFVARGRLRQQDRLLYPVLKPAPVPPPEKVPHSPDYRTFVEHWRVAHSTDFIELEVARSTVKRIRKVLLSDYKRWRTLRTDSAAYKEEISESSESLKSAAAAGKQADSADVPACLPLAELRHQFPSEAIDDETLEALDTHFQTQLRERYSPQAYISFVRTRAASTTSKFRAGLALDRKKGLPHDFVKKVKQDEARRRAIAAAEKEQGERDWKHTEKLARDTLADPTASEEDKNMARSVLADKTKGAES